jgi:hypothetical protein
MGNSRFTARVRSLVSALLLLAGAAGADVVIKGGASSDVACVDSVSKGLCVQQPTSANQAGVGVVAGRSSISGGTYRVNPGYVTEGGRLAVAPVTLLWDDTFNATAQNTAKYRAPTTTMTVTYVAGYAIVNGGSITTINTNAAIQTYRTFPLFAKSETRINMSVMRTVAPQANCAEEMGLFSATLPGAAAPTDGVFFRWNTAGELRGVINFNGTETQTAAITSPSINVNHDYVIVTQTNTVLFLIDDSVVGTVTLLTDAPTLGQPMAAATQPFTFRQYIGGSAPSLANQLKISDVFVSLLGADPQRSWAETKAGMGHMGYQGQNGGTMGSTANYANSANPTAAVPTNTTAALGTGLGGQFWETASLALGTDGIICSFQNPAGSVAQTPRNLIIFGVFIDSSIQTVITGGPFVKNYSLAYGHTAVSLATAEAATTKAPRRIALGKMTVTAAQAVATLLAGSRIQFRFTAPIVVAPGEFVAIVTKHETGGTVGTAGTIAHQITFDAYFE